MDAKVVTTWPFIATLRITLALNTSGEPLACDGLTQTVHAMLCFTQNSILEGCLNLNDLCQNIVMFNLFETRLYLKQTSILKII